MGEPMPRAHVSGWLVLALVVAVAAMGVAGAALVWARNDRDDSQQRRAAVEAVLHRNLAAGSPDRLASARAAISGVRAQLDALPAESTHVADLTEQDAALVQSALDAGAKGDLDAYNAAVAKRNDLAPQVDAAVEKLRVDTNAVLEALAVATSRTSP